MFKDPNFKEYLQYLSLGAEIAAALSIPIFIGYWLDGRLDTSPWLLLLGALTGMAIMIGIVFRIARDMEKGDKGH